MTEPVIRVTGLKIAYRDADSWLRVLHGVDFTIARGEVLGLVGESGCGKSTAGLQLLGYRHPNMRVEGGQVLFQGQDLLSLRRRELDRLRGDRIGFVPQNPTTALNPGIRVGRQVAETLILHKRAEGLAKAFDRAAELFDLVGLPEPRRLLARYPHQLSGGQQQRVCIAIAVACEPDLVVLDEPTTGLDVTTQEQIISLLVNLRARLGTAMLYVTHDLGVLAQIADRVGVMYAGHIVETAPAAELFGAPRHPYTKGLVASVPRIDDPVNAAQAMPLQGALRRRELPPGCPFAPRCAHSEPSCWERRQFLEEVRPDHRVACQRWRAVGAGRVAAEVIALRGPNRTPEPILSLQEVTLAYGRQNGLVGRWLPGKPFVAVRDLSFVIGKGETFALVGESGSGKSTVARAVSGLLPSSTGTIRFDGAPLAGSYRNRTADERRRIQYVFQNPDASLNPRAPVGKILGRPLQMFLQLSRREAEARIERALSDVQLEAGYAARYADQLSGGERQRVAIARALIAEPELLLCDEILSALDVSVQANIIQLLRRLRAERAISMLFISHDLAVVRSLADTVAVLFRGQLMEIGRNEDIFAPPYHPYTHSLLMAVPTIASVTTPRRTARFGARATESGRRDGACAFAGRCPWQPGRICQDIDPPWRVTQSGLSIRCHLPLPELASRAEWGKARTNFGTRLTEAKIS
ncbi:MAG: ABC transporter ATP-binding protein [Rhizobiales bacterium]|nr:ABC transporter ATP-binding protein [Hyphomicrobiales bacterium]